MEHERIALYNVPLYFQTALRRFLERTDVSARNKELVQTYLRDAALGKTVVNGAHRPLGVARRSTYLNTLISLIDFTHKDLDAVVMEDLERFIEALANELVFLDPVGELEKTTIVKESNVVPVSQE